MKCCGHGKDGCASERKELDSFWKLLLNRPVLENNRKMRVDYRAATWDETSTINTNDHYQFCLKSPNSKGARPRQGFIFMSVVSSKNIALKEKRCECGQHCKCHVKCLIIGSNICFLYIVDIYELLDFSLCASPISIYCIYRPKFPRFYPILTSNCAS